MRALYLHVPFCPSICPYCDFHKMRRHEGLVAAYLDKVKRDTHALYHEFPSTLETIYFGGGTPSQLSNAELAAVIGALEPSYGWPARLETTLEADPLTFDAARLESFRAMGFSRLSIGLQSTQDAVLRFLGRKHNAQEGVRAVEMALAAGFEVSADIITAVPGQDAALDLHRIAALGVPHVSVYNLTIEPFTPFARRGVVVDEDKEADDYALAGDILAQYGLERYEVSSHAKPGHASKHNQVYWHGEPFLALGPSAAAFVPSRDSALIGERRTERGIKAWLAGEPPEILLVTPHDYVLDVLMTGLRTRRGVDLETLYHKTGINVRERYARVIEAQVRGGWLELGGHTLRATDAGIVQLNRVVGAFFEHA